MDRLEGEEMNSVEPSPTQEHIGIAQPPTLNLLAVAAAIDFEPDGAPSNAVELSFLSAANPTVRWGAGVYRIEFVRPLSDDERKRPLSKLLRALADGSVSDRVTEAEDLGTGRRDTNNTSLHSEEKEETR